MRQDTLTVRRPCPSTPESFSSVAEVRATISPSICPHLNPASVTAPVRGLCVAELLASTRAFGRVVFHGRMGFSR